VDDAEWLSERFEESRPRLRAVAYRMLGSVAEADDAVQETWLRLGRADSAGVDNLQAWLTTVVARVCLNMLRTRNRRREEPLDDTGNLRRAPVEDAGGGSGIVDPEQEAVLAESVGLALLVVLDTLAPAERLAFVLHDMFDLPFDEIGPLVGRSPEATRQLASRARRRVRGVRPTPGADQRRQRRVVDAYLAATRHGDFEALVALLDPDVVLHADAEAGFTGEPVDLHGVQAVARGAVASRGRARFTAAALVDGRPGLVMAPRGRLMVAMAFTVVGDLVTEIDVIADPERLEAVELAVLDDA
jgi:RNA polymerase sigma-70 factor (ECF subfamily)